MSRFNTRPRWGRYVPKLPPVPIAKKGPRSRLNRRQSPTRVRLAPIFSVLIASMLPLLVPIVTDMPILPPFGFMVFVGWRLLRPGLWPLWVGFPFGLFDDLCSGQPFGSGALLWSVLLLALELWEQRQLGRDFVMDWLIVAIAIIFVLLGGAYMVGLTQMPPSMLGLLPQIGISLLLFPLIMRGVAAVDRWRLAS